MKMKVFDSFGDGKLKKFLSDSFSFLFEVRLLKMREDLRKGAKILGQWRLDIIPNTEKEKHFKVVRCR